MGKDQVFWRTLKETYSQAFQLFAPCLAFTESLWFSGRSLWSLKKKGFFCFFFFWQLSIYFQVQCDRCTPVASTKDWTSHFLSVYTADCISVSLILSQIQHVQEAKPLTQHLHCEKTTNQPNKQTHMLYRKSFLMQMYVESSNSGAYMYRNNVPRRFCFPSNWWPPKIAQMSIYNQKHNFCLRKFYCATFLYEHADFLLCQFYYCSFFSFF